MKYIVYHAKEPTFSDNPQDFKMSDFEAVASVDCDTLEEVFYLTNHIDKPWWDNPQVNLLKRSRSTSVGDVVEQVEANALKKFRCQSAGWKEIV